MLDKAKRVFLFPENTNKEFILKPNDDGIEYDVRKEKEPPAPARVFESIDENLSYIKARFTYPLNNDIVIREIRMRKGRRAFLIFIDGMVDTAVLDDSVIKSLLQLPYYADDEIYKYEEEIAERFVSHSQTTATEDMEFIIEEINFGGCGVFIDGFKKGISLDIRNWGHRAIDKPTTEQTIYGPQEAFAEMLRNNSALVRKIIKTEKLISEGVKIGAVSKTRGVLMYISDIANEDLVSEARRRINSISADYVITIEEVMQFIEESSFVATTQIMSTERPDKVARALIEGRIVLLLNGSPRALIFPTTAFELSHSASDDYLRVPYVNMSRVVRLIAVFMSILLPGLYLATTLFHQEVIPTYLLYSISASRENVPFPSIIELILMDLSFEMIREAGIRMPSPIGSTLGIVGGLILGQAAVSARIVSPIMIIVIAITGIGSFATVDYSLSWSFRILRMVFIVLGSLLGYYGIAMGIFVYSVILGRRKSFGVPFLQPLPKSGSRHMSGALFVNAIWKREKRPSYLYTKDDREEQKISRKWKIK